MRTYLLGSVFILCHVQHYAGDLATVEVLPNVIATASSKLIGLGIEDVNHELYGGIYSQMLYGEDFEEPAAASGVSGDFMIGRDRTSPTWSPVATNADELGSGPTFETVSSNVFNGNQAQLLIAGSKQPARIINHGLYRQGLFFAAGQKYEGYTYARMVQSAGLDAPLLDISLVRATGLNLTSTLDTISIPVSNHKWKRFGFDFTPSRDTSCTVIKSAEGCTLHTPEGECVVCDGGLMLSVSGGAIAIDFIFLQPGEWGRFQGLPVRKDVVDAFQSLGLNSLRLGGSTCNVDGWRWKNMRGAREKRQPYTGEWHPYASQGWRIFEFLDLCEHLDVQAVVTLNNNESPEDLADLIEYAYGSVDTAWGRLRVEDGQHPEPYRPFVVEIGNEQPLSYELIRQVSDGAEAMRVRASVVGQEQSMLHFAIGSNLDMDMINTPLSDAMVNATKFLGENVMWDLHVDGDTPDEEDHWDNTLQMALQMLDRLDSKMKLAVFEENANRHDLVRGLNRARYANTYARLGNRFVIGAAANGLQVIGQNDNGWDQGAVFMAPDRVWLSPFGYVDSVVASASLPVVLQTKLRYESDSSVVRKLDALAMRSYDGTELALRVVNFNTLDSEPLDLGLVLPVGWKCGNATITTLELPLGLDPRTVNPPSNVTKVSPSVRVDQDLLSLRSLPLSFKTVRWSSCIHRKFGDVPRLFV